MKIKSSERKIVATILTLFLFFLTANAQNIAVKGVVKDQAGEPIIGANVVVKGATMGTVTDINGSFKLNTNPKGVLNITYVGYLPQSIPLNGKTAIEVVMIEDAKALDELVVVGYGSMKKSDLTGAVVSIGSDAIDKTISTSIDQVLQGRAAGVQMVQNSGMPGGGSSIRIRGVNSLSGSNEPIYVIDGVIIDASTGSDTDNALSSINPNDIQSMEILKDASATAIYGSRAANGVIIITTKSASENKGFIAYDGYFGAQQIPKYIPLMNLQQYAQHHNERSAVGMTTRNANFFNPSLLSLGTDWQKELFRSALMHSHNVSASMGTKAIRFSLSLGYLGQEGIAYGSSFERLTLRSSVEAQIKPWVKVGATVNVARSFQNISISDNNIINTALNQTPNTVARNADGSWGAQIDTEDYVQTNPIAMALLRENNNIKANVRSNVFATFTFLKDFTFKTEFASDLGIVNTYQFNPYYKIGNRENNIIESTRGKSYNQYWNWKNILTYKKTFAKKHNLNVMLAQESQNTMYETLTGYRQGFVSNAAHNLDAGDANTARNRGYESTNSLASYMGRIFYSFGDRYLFTGTLRCDGSSRFAEGNRWGWFPSAAVAWKLSSEEFMKPVKEVNNLKLRLGWGAVGNQSISNYAYTSVLSTVQTIWGSGFLTGNISNPDLTWETTYSTNLGIDLGMFRNRVELIVDGYYKQTNNLLLQIPLPTYVGAAGTGSASAPWMNIGSMQNVGVEVTLNTVNISNKDFNWRTGVVFSLNRNKVLALTTETGALDRSISNELITRTMVGHPAGMFYGYQVVGRFNSGSDFYYVDESGVKKQIAIPQDQVIKENGGIWVGDYIYKDINKDGVINEEDRTFIGCPEPKFTYGINNSFSYKNFDLSIQLNGVYGNQVYNWLRRSKDDPRQSTNLRVIARDYARVGMIDPTGSTTDVLNYQVVSGDPMMPGMRKADTNTNYRVSDLFVEDGSYLRIQNISFGYTFPKVWLPKLKMSNLKIYANIQNVFTFSSYQGYDPDLGSSRQDALMTGVDNGRYPSPRIYTVGLKVSF